MPPPDLSAIVLCYRAGESILRVIEPLHRQLEESGVSYELVLVANHDRDGHDRTPAVVESFAREHESVRALVRVKEGGMGWDMRTGLETSRGEVMVVVDGDAQNPVDDVLKTYWRLRQTGADVMKGRRIARFDGVYRRVLSVVYNGLFTLVFRTRGMWDINGKPKGLTRGAYKRIELHSDDWFIDAEILLEARAKGLRIAEMPVVFHRNEERASFVRASAISEFVRNMIRYRLGRWP